MSQPSRSANMGTEDFSPGMWRAISRSVFVVVTAAIVVDFSSAAVYGCRSNAQQLCLPGTADHGFARAGDHVDLAADAEVAGKVQAGLDREAGVGQQQALVVGFQVVEVGAVAVQLRGDVVAGSVGEEVRKTGVADEVARGVVGLPAGDGLGGGVGLLHAGDGGIAGVAHQGEDLLFARCGFAAYHAGPGDVIPDRLRVVGQ